MVLGSIELTFRSTLNNSILSLLRKVQKPVIASEARQSLHAKVLIS